MLYPISFPWKYCFGTRLHFTTRLVELVLYAVTKSGARDGAEDIYRDKQKLRILKIVPIPFSLYDMELVG